MTDGRGTVEASGTAVVPAVSDPQKRLEDFRELKKVAQSEHQKATESLRQIALIGGPAAILASLTFIKDLAPHPVVYSAAALAGAWGAFLVGAWLALSSLKQHRMAARAFEKLLDRKIEQGNSSYQKGDFDEMKPPNDRSEVLGARAIRWFLGGVVLLVLFAVANLPFGKAISTGAAASEDAAGAATLGEDAARDLLKACEVRTCVVVVPSNQSPLEAVKPPHVRPGDRSRTSGTQPPPRP